MFGAALLGVETGFGFALDVEFAFELEAGVGAGDLALAVGAAEPLASAIVRWGGVDVGWVGVEVADAGCWRFLVGKSELWRVPEIKGVVDYLA